MFCFLGGGRVFASSWIWFCIEGDEKLKAGGGSDLAGGWAARDAGSGADAHWETELDASGWSLRSMAGAGRGAGLAGARADRAGAERH